MSLVIGKPTSPADTLPFGYLLSIVVFKIFSKTIETPFDGLMAFSDATLIWGLNESTLRKAIAYGKLINGIDVCKYGKQWVVSMKAMEREYGMPKNK